MAISRATTTSKIKKSRRKKRRSRSDPGMHHEHEKTTEEDIGRARRRRKEIFTTKARSCARGAETSQSRRGRDSTEETTGRVINSAAPEPTEVTTSAPTGGCDAGLRHFFGLFKSGLGLRLE
ncbi:hypothetical protein GW17_00047813 [Ensete ventricosum]|nr:hypothetical protein GW17_00047813 [Ensete ventricosum]